jgi:hypothetical protein
MTQRFEQAKDIITRWSRDFFAANKRMTEQERMDYSVSVLGGIGKLKTKEVEVLYAYCETLSKTKKF